MHGRNTTHSQEGLRFLGGIYLLGWLDQEMFQQLGQAKSRDSAANFDRAVIFVINR